MESEVKKAKKIKIKTKFRTVTYIQHITVAYLTYNSRKFVVAVFLWHSHNTFESSCMRKRYLNRLIGQNYLLLFPLVHCCVVFFCFPSIPQFCLFLS